MWNRIQDEIPPFYKKIQVWVDNDERKASFTSEHEFIYWDGDSEPMGFPTHWRSIVPPTESERVC